MKTYSYVHVQIRVYVAKFFLEWEISQREVSKKLKTQMNAQFILSDIPPPRKLCHL
jgi:hypothetical protein